MFFIHTINPQRTDRQYENIGRHNRAATAMQEGACIQGDDFCFVSGVLCVLWALRK